MRADCSLTEITDSKKPIFDLVTPGAQIQPVAEPLTDMADKTRLGLTASHRLIGLCQAHLLSLK